MDVKNHNNSEPADFITVKLPSDRHSVSKGGTIAKSSGRDMPGGRNRQIALDRAPDYMERVHIRRQSLFLAGRALLVDIDGGTLM